MYLVSQAILSSKINQSKGSSICLESPHPDCHALTSIFGGSVIGSRSMYRRSGALLRMARANFWLTRWRTKSSFIGRIGRLNAQLSMHLAFAR